MKKLIIVLVLGLFLAGIMSSCAIDRKCPAYSQATTDASASGSAGEIV